MVKASSQRRSSQPGATPSRDEAEGVSKHQPPSQGVRRNCPWTEAEHLLFLLGLEEHGRGAWRAIASDFVGTRTATQVASHAQKYFLREGLPPSKREKKRPSIHDIRCSRNASQEDRYQLRNSLQQLNRESMESNDSRHAETQHASPKPGTGPLAGRAARPRAETGSSGDTSVAAGTRPAPSTPPRRRLYFPSKPPAVVAPTRTLQRSRCSMPERSRPPAPVTGASRAASVPPTEDGQLPCSPTPGMPNWSGDAAYSYGGDGGAMPRSLATEASAGRPRAWSLPDWQFPGRSTPLVSGPDAFSCGASVLPDTSDPAVGILDPLYDEVLNCDLSPDPHSGSRAAPGRASDMSLEHSFDQTQLMRGNSADTRPLFPLSEAQQTVPEDNLLLGSAPTRTMPERRTPWQPPMYTPYGNTNMYESMFRSEADGAFMRGAPAGRASLPNYPPQPQHSTGGQDTMQERHMLASFDSSHCAQPSLRSSFPQAPMQGPAQSRALGDAPGANMQLPQLGSLLSSQSAPPGNALMGPYSSALYRPTQLSLATPMTTAAEPSFGAAGAAGMPSGDSVDDLRVLAQRADEMGIASDMDQQNMDEILGSMSLGMEMDL